jgi:hypothetical protein
MTTPNTIVVSPAHQAMADANAIGRPTIDQYFEDVVNPTTQQNLRVTATRVVSLIIEVLAVEPCSKAVNSEIIKTDLITYPTTIQGGVIATVSSESSVSPCAVNHRHVRLVFINLLSKPQHNGQNISSKP